MSFHFNWSRLDETVSDAIRQLINEQLRLVLRAKFGQYRPEPPKRTSADTLPSEPVSSCNVANATYTIGSSSVNGSGLSGPHHGPSPSAAASPAATTAGASASPTFLASHTLPALSIPPLDGGATVSPMVPPTMPTVVHLAVSSLEWGTSPPFVELVSFENARTTVPGAAKATAHSLHGGSGGRGFSDSFDSSPAGAGGGASFLSLATPGLPQQQADMEGGLGSPGQPSLPSNSSSNGYAVNCTDALSDTHSSTGMVGYSNWGGYSAAEPSLAPTVARASMAHGGSVTGAVVDTLAPFLGPGGLFLKLHVTYGGSLRFSIEAVVEHHFVLGPLDIPVRMAIALHAADVDLDCYVCVNIHDNACQLWLEPGRLSTMPINRLNLSAVFGERSTDAGEVNSSSAGFPSRYGSSLSEDEDDTVLLDEREIAQFILVELRSLLQEKLMAPHHITIPLVLGSGR